MASCLNVLGNAHRMQGGYAQADPLFQRALAIREATLGKNHPDVAGLLNNLGILYASQEFYARAEPLFERAFAIREAALGRNHPDVAASLNNLALLYKAQSFYARAKPLLERALAIREAALGKNHPDVAASLTNLALIYQVQGFYGRAEPLFERALAIQEAVLGKNHPDVAITLHNLATGYKDQGHYARAEPLFERALVIREAALGKHHPDVASSLNNLATLYESQGLHARVEPLYERALAIRESALGKNHPYVANSLHNLGSLYWNQGLYARGKPLLERALAIREAAALGKNDADLARSLKYLGHTYESQGIYTQAEAMFERALAMEEATLGKNHPQVARSLIHLARCYASQGRYAQAEPLLARALPIWEAAFGKNHPFVAETLNHLGRLHIAQQQLDKALPLFARAFTLSEEHLRQEVLGLSEVRLANVLRILRYDEERLYALVRAYPDDSRVRHLALSAALLRKGRSVEEVSDTSRIIYHGLDQADRETFERLRALRTQFATLSLAGPGQLSLADHEQHLKDLAAQGDALEADLVRRSAPLRALHALPAPAEFLDRVAKALPSNGTLVEFVAYDDRPLVPKPDSSPSHVPSELRYLALLLFPDGRTHAVDLGPAAPIDRAALSLHDALARRSVAYQTAAQKLHALVFRPLEPLLGKAQRLFLSPDGQLALVPFAALHDERQLLVDSFDITYLTSGKDLLPRPEDLPPARSVVVLADPDFSAPAAPSLVAQASTVPGERSAALERFYSTSRALSEQLWPPLPGTRKEAEAIQHLLPRAQLFLGSAATKDALLKLATPGLLHIATHGFFFEDTPTPQDTRAVAHTDVSSLTGPRHRPPDPLLRSGVVLAGIQAPEAQPGSHRPEDSLVTALELAGLNLWGTQLVVLSACDTGRGDIKLGQGVYGLRRALMVAGAETLVTSLWKVNDE